MTNNIIEVTSENFVELVIKGSEKLPIVVDFWAPWCSPCKQLTPIIEKAVNNFPDKVILAKVNIDDNQSIASQMQIQSIPMVYAFFNGQVVDGFQGNIPESQVLEFIQKISDAYKVYYVYENFNFFKSIFYLIKLSLYSIKRKF